jgi:multiple sugar transport system permease protein
MTTPTTMTASQTPRAERWRSMKRALRRLPLYGFIAPYLIFFGLFSIGPILYGFYMSLFHWQILATHQPFAGLDNYRKLLDDTLFWTSVKNTLYFAGLTVAVETLLALLVALAVRSRFPLRGFFQFIFYAPVTLSAAVMGVIMTQLISSGALNYYLGPIGYGNFAFLGNGTTVIPTLALVSVWWGFGFPMLVFLAGLYNIPSDLYDAAHIDGAGTLQSFVSVTLPLLRPTLLFVLVILTIAHMQVFAQNYIMSGGGPGYSSLSMVQYLYENAWQFCSTTWATPRLSPWHWRC